MDYSCTEKKKKKIDILVLNFEAVLLAGMKVRKKDLL